MEVNGCLSRELRRQSSWEIDSELQKCILLNYELNLDETPFCKHCIQRLLEQIAVVEQSVSDAIYLATETEKIARTKTYGDERTCRGRCVCIL